MGCHTIRRYVFLVWILIELLFFGGILNGWGALVFVLKEEGIFAELCEGNHTSSSSVECAERDERFNLYFAIATSLGYTMLCITSGLFAKFGTRKTRSIFSLCFAAGCLMMAMADNDTPWLICVGGVFVTGFGISLMITSMQVSVLFPKHSSTVVGLIDGTFDSSAVVPLVIKKLYSSGVSRQTSFIALMFLSTITFVSTFLFFPKTLLVNTKLDQEIIVTVRNEVQKKSNKRSAINHSSIKTFDETQDVMAKTADKHTDGVNQEGNVETIVDKQNEIVEASGICLAIQNNDIKQDKDVKVSVISIEHNKRMQRLKELIETSPVIVNQLNNNNELDPETFSSDSTNVDNKNNIANDKPNLKGFRKNVLNSVYLTNVVWLLILQLRLLYFIGTINSVIVKLTHDKEESVSYFTDILSYAMFCGCVTSFGFGYLYDYQKSFFKRILHPTRRTYASSIGPLSLTSVLASILSGIMFVQSEHILYVVPVMLTLFRSMLWTVASSFLVDVFPLSQFGELYALRMFVANIFGFVQFALFRWANAYSGGQLHVNIMLSVLCCVSFVHPISVFKKTISIR